MASALSLINFEGEMVTAEELELLQLYKQLAPAVSTVTLQPMAVVGDVSKKAPEKAPVAPVAKPVKLTGVERIKQHLMAKRGETAAASTAVTPSPAAVIERSAQEEESARVKRPKVAAVKAALTVSTELNKTAFPPEDLVRESDWDPKTATENLMHDLPDFGLDKKQTLVLRITVPADSLTWGLSICAKIHEEYMNVLYHFNPRQMERGGILVQNDRDGYRWNLADRKKLANMVPMFGRTFDLAIQINETGFHAAIDGVYATSFPHRTKVADWESKELFLEVPNQDDYGNPEVLIVHQIWWGQKKPFNDMPGPGELEMESQEYTHIHVAGLPPVDNPTDEAQLTALVEEAFKPFGLDNVRVFGDRSFGFCFFTSHAGAKEAIAARDHTEISGSRIKVTPGRKRQ